MIILNVGSSALIVFVWLPQKHGYTEYRLKAHYLTTFLERMTRVLSINILDDEKKKNTCTKEITLALS